MMMLLLVVTIAVLAVSAATETVLLTKEDVLTTEYKALVPCAYLAKPILPCWKNNCGRRVVDGLFSEVDITQLHGIAAKALDYRGVNEGGPTIIDINTGYIRDSQGVVNLFTETKEIYTTEDFNHYGDIIKRLRQHVMATFELEELYFTAPTFITRLDGRAEWEPKEIHDEYWHVHADMNNTKHYHYSGLLYLSNYNTDFDGGRLHFVRRDYEEENETNNNNNNKSEVIVEPKAGRVVIFTSGPENPHYVERVTRGQRFVLAFWFTCDKKRQFEIFLDGKAHREFSHSFKKDNNNNNNNKQQKKNKNKSKNGDDEL